jgi:hypothetical protein
MKRGIDSANAPAAVEETRRLFSDVPWRIGSVIYAHPALEANPEAAKSTN